MFFDNTILTEALKMLSGDQLINEADKAIFSSRTEVLTFDGTTLTLSVPSQFYLDRFNNHIKNHLQTALSEIEGQPITLVLTIKERLKEEPSQPLYTLTKKNEAVKQTRAKARPTDLQTIYSFNTFVPGENNSFALGICKWIAENPDGNKYNPCLISGGVGLGKTHLLKAIGNFMYDNNPSLNIKYITGKTMFTETTDSTKNGNFHEYWQQYDNLDLLLIDDIHELENKNTTQEQLYSKLDILATNKKPIIFTCDRPITELKKITPRLLSRFTRGTIVDLQLPSFETKVAIINKKLELKGKNFPTDVTELIARNMNQSIREIESAIDSLEAYSEMTGKPITLDLARARLHIQLQNNMNQETITSIALVQKIIADYFNISSTDLKSKKKTKSIVYPRQLAMYILRQVSEYSTTEIGIEFGNRDHSTVMHACTKIEELLKTDPKQETTVQNLIRAIREKGLDSL